jgi:hypothetical protein
MTISLRASRGLKCGHAKKQSPRHLEAWTRFKLGTFLQQVDIVNYVTGWVPEEL